MRTKILFLAMLCLAVLVGCDKQNGEPDDPTTDPNPRVGYEVEYGLTLHEDYLDIYDVEITYVDATGKKVTEAMTNPWAKKLKWSVENAPDSCGFTAIGTPKIASAAEVTKEVIHLKCNKHFLVYEMFKDGQKGILHTSSGETDLPIAHDKIDQLIAKGKREIANLWCALKK